MKRILGAACLIASSLSRLSGLETDGVSRFVGDWRGESSCIAKNTACHDENVVYHVARIAGKPAFVSIVADKIVDGKAVNMGTLEFRYEPDQDVLICEYAQGTWRLEAAGGAMKGTLTRPDKTVFRRVELRKQH